MRIVTKTISDLVPKWIMLLIVNKVTDFLREELPAHLYARGHDTDALMEESQLEAQKRQEVIRMYQACKEALQIIVDANLDGLQMDHGFVSKLKILIFSSCLDAWQSILRLIADLLQCLQWVVVQCQISQCCQEIVQVCDFRKSSNSLATAL